MTPGVTLVPGLGSGSGFLFRVFALIATVIKNDRWFDSRIFAIFLIAQKLEKAPKVANAIRGGAKNAEWSHKGRQGTMHLR
jgi:hypothetical protein